jgi:hypothetical protein
MISNPVDTILVVYKCIKIQLWTCCCKTQMSLSAHSQFFSINFLETHSLWFLSNIHTNFEAISQNHTLLLCSFRKPLLFCCRKHLITCLQWSWCACFLTLLKWEKLAQRLCKIELVVLSKVWFLEAIVERKIYLTTHHALVVSWDAQ